MERSDNFSDDEKGLLRRIGHSAGRSSGKNPLAGRDLSKIRDPNGDGVVYRGKPWETVLPDAAPDVPEPPKSSRPKLDAFGTVKGKKRKWVKLGEPAFGRPSFTDSLADADGVYPRERRALHKRIRRHLMPEPKVAPKPAGERTIFMLGGGPAAGKSSLTDHGVVSFPGKDAAYHLSADDVKVLIPEYQQWTDDGYDAAEFVHEESRHVNNYMVDRAVQSGHDFLLDSTGDGSYSRHRRRIRDMKRNGHRVVANYVTSSLPTALRRAEERRIKTGRGVPEHQIIHAHQQVSRVVPLSLKDGLFDEFYLWDNDIDGAEPTLIAHLDDTGHLVVLDQDKWMAFIKKGAKPKKRQPKGKKKPASGFSATRLPGFGGQSVASRSDEFEQLLAEQAALHGTDPFDDPYNFKAAPKENVDPAVAEALRIIGDTTSAFDTEQLIAIERRVIERGKATTPLEQYLLDAYKARDKDTEYENPFDLPERLSRAATRAYDADEREEERQGKSIYSGMVTGTPSRFGRVERDGQPKKQSTRKRRRQLVEERRQLAKPSGSLNTILTKGYYLTNDVIDTKTFAIAALIDKTCVMQEMKVGLVGSHDRTVQIAESVVSYAVPGDMSRLRSPVRSALYRAATPGGGGGGGGNRIGRAIGRGAQAMRCPTGYQYGGRFSNRFLSNCGQQLFDVPGIELNEPNAPAPVRITRTIRNIGALGTQRAGLGRIGAGEYSTIDATISRMANVPHVGAFNKRKSDEQILSGIAAAAAAKTDFVRLVRRDGVSLDSKVDLPKLASQRNNPDMVDGTVISRAARFTKLGNNEVPLLGAGIKSIRLITPGGNELRLDRNRNMTSGELSKLRRQWAAIQRTIKDDDGALGLQRLAASIEALTYSEKFNNIERPNELVRIERNGVERTVPRWAFLAFFADSAPGRDEKDQAWKELSVVAQADDQAVTNGVTTLAAAVSKLDNNGNIDEVPSKFLADVTSNSKMFTATPLGNGRTMLVRKNGDRLIKTETDSRSALSEKVAADLERTFGVPSPVVRLGGTGAKRSVFVDPADKAVPNGKLVVDRGLANARRDDLARIALVDYLLGRENRSPGSIGVVADGNKTRLVSTAVGSPNMVAALVRRPEEVLTSDGHWTQGYFAQPQRQVRQSILKMYDNLLESATSFDWDGYLTRLGLGGDLSEADKVHLATIRRLYATRLDKLRSSKKVVLRVFGVGSL